MNAEVTEKIENILNQNIGTEACRVASNFDFPTHFVRVKDIKERGIFATLESTCKENSTALRELPEEVLVFLFVDDLARCGRGLSVAVTLDGKIVTGWGPLATAEALFK